MRRILSAALLAAAFNAAFAGPTAVADDANYRPRLSYHACFGDYLAVKKDRQPDLTASPGAGRTTKQGRKTESPAKRP